jgi:hypothetical protein
VIDTPLGEILFDCDDLPVVSIYAWRVKVSTLSRSVKHAKADTKERGSVLMHRLILGLSDKRILVDHINRNGLDNRRANLRLATLSQNMCNRSVFGRHSKYAGLTKDRDKFRFQVICRGQIVVRGNAVDEIVAALIRDKYASMHQGEYANLNFRDENDVPEAYRSIYEDIMAGRESRYASVFKQTETVIPLAHQIIPPDTTVTPRRKHN